VCSRYHAEVKTVLQRVAKASVRVDGHVVACIERGVLALCCVERGDGPADALMTARKIAGLRLFAGVTPMDRSLTDVGGQCLLVSQFTLTGRVDKGRRPSFDRAEEPREAEALWRRVGDDLGALGVPVQLGVFGAHMEVDLINDGPVTLLVFTRGGALIASP
jgi:D-tyrosyl-tRNA(Tyr) deacylase